MNTIYTDDNEDYPAYSVEDDYSEVIQLTEFNDPINSSSRFPGTIAEYKEIDHIQVNKKHEATARTFVSNIAKFVIELDDDKLAEDHKAYLETVAELEISSLTDMLYLVDINKQMISNIVDRINATMVEDYAILASYNSFVNQHVKLIRELSNTYKNIPSVLKRMKTDVITDQVLTGGNDNKNIITSEFGDHQFNSQKQLLKTILENHKVESDLV